MATATSEERIEYLSTVLRQVPLFSDLHDSHLQRLAGIAQEQTYPRGAPLFRQGDTDNAMYVLVSGQVAIYHLDAAGVEAFVSAREPGPDGGMGEATLLLNDPHDATAVAQSDVEVLSIEGKALRELLNADPSLKGRLRPKRETAERLRLLTENYSWLTEGESILKLVRRHPWALVRQTIFTIWVLIVVNLCALLVSSTFGLNIVFTISLLGAAILCIGIGVYAYLNYKNDFYVVTSKRVLHVDQVPLGRQRFEAAPLAAIQEIQFERNTILAHLLDFGNLSVETYAGSVAMNLIPQPVEIKSLIFRQVDVVTSRSRAAARKAVRDELERRIGQRAAPPEPRAQQEGPEAANVRTVVQGALRYFLPRFREVVGDSVVYRKHWIVLLRVSYLPLIALLLTTVAAVSWLDPTSLLGSALPDEFWIVWVILLLAFAAWMLWAYEDYRNDLYIVTSTRIIDLRRTPFLLQETRKEAGLDKVVQQDVEVPSWTARLFRFGTVIVKVATGDFRFADVSHPTDVAAEISRRVDDFRRRQAEEEARRRRTELSDWFATYDRIKSGEAVTANRPEPGE